MNKRKRSTFPEFIIDSPDPEPRPRRRRVARTPRRTFPGLPLLPLIVLLATCSPLPRVPPPDGNGVATAPGVPEPEETGWFEPAPPPELSLEALEIQITDAFPLQVDVALRGQVPDCEEITDIMSFREQNVFTLEVDTENKANKECAATRPFERRVPLRVDGLRAGIYQVKAGKLNQSFELVVDNIVRW